MPGQYFINTTSTDSFDIDLPSGGKVRAHKLKIEDLVSLGMLDQMDSLGALVQTEHIDRVKGTGKPSDRPKKKPTKAEKAKLEEKQTMDAMKGIMGDRQKWSALEVTMDRIFVDAVEEPEVRLAYIEESEMDSEGVSKPVFIRHKADDRANRRQDVVWSDQVSLEDKMHVFGMVLPGSDKMAPFREERAEAVGDVDDQPEDEVQPL